MYNVLMPQLGAAIGVALVAGVGAYVIARIVKGLR